MSDRERRVSMALDDAYNYCRMLTMREEKGDLLRLCAALHTVDAALESETGAASQFLHISTQAWSRIRNTLFDFLLTATPGYFLVYKDSEASPVEPGSEWPEHGLLEFFPESARRRDDSYFCDLDSLDFKTKTNLRWCFAEGRTNIRPADFAPQPALQEDEVSDFLTHLDEVCAEEAHKGKKRAHQKWWQLYWEATSCRNAQQKRRLHKDMDKLQVVWGKPG